MAERRQRWCDENGYVELAKQFDDPAVCSGTEEYVDRGVTWQQKLKLAWRSEGFGKLVCLIDHQIKVGSLIGSSKRPSKMVKRSEAVQEEATPRIPVRRSRQVYDSSFLEGLTEITRQSLRIREDQIMTEDCRPFAR